jgi:Fe-S-cluster-containing hydrogenase component 2
MAKLEQHPNVIAVRRRMAQGQAVTAPAVLDADWLRSLCLRLGADDVGFVDLGLPELAEERERIAAAFPRPHSAISFVCKLNREAIRTPARSHGHLEYHHGVDHTNEVSRRVVAELESIGVRAFNGSVGFPMEMDRFPEGYIWVVSHKPIAEAAGMGKMGIHRNVIHPRFGNFILLGTVVVDTPISAYARPLDYNPCLECKLCVAACPTGAIKKDGQFDFGACYTHNYRHFLGGFTDWVEDVVDSTDAKDYRSRMSDSETASVWQSLTTGSAYKAAYCVSVCPAGEDVLGPYLDDRKTHLDEVVRPLQDKVETVYVVANSDAEAYTNRRFPHKRTKRVGNGLRPRTVDGFAVGLTLTFQREAAGTLDAVYHFTFTGAEQRELTVEIRDAELSVRQGHHGEADLRVRADTSTWFGFLAGDRSLVAALVTGRIRLRGSPRLLQAFGRCFPS